MKRIGPILVALALAVSAATPAHAQPMATGVARAKVAVVAVGDADERLRAAALRVEDAIIAGNVRVAEDAGLRAALRGEAAPAEDDGLASVRRMRRALGLGEVTDAPSLARLGRMAGALLIVAVRADGHGGIEAVTLQVAAGQFYAGTLDAEHAEPGRIARAVARRAEHAIAAAASSAGAATGARAQTPAGRAHPGPHAATAPDSPPEHKSFLEKSWPYLVAGALLAGFVTYIVIDSTSGNEPAQTPVLRFSPGP